MNWFYCNNDNYVQIVCTNPNKHTYNICLSPNTKDVIKHPMYDNNMRYLLIKVNNNPTLDDIKKHLIYLQQEYDNSVEVNSFYIDTERCWFDKVTRVGLVNGINLQKIIKNSTYKVWFNNNFIELDIDRALTLLATIEDYTGKCYNVTQQHITQINNLQSLEEALQFDITADYPEYLNITLN